MTPYDNGKVKMGIYYEPPQYVEYDRDMLEIQKWLIGDPKKLRFEYWCNVAYIVALCFVGLILILSN
jgi:putative ubiquitin-RnfH superfamily antitoxin RatB of RatAB toxin-antitoxin module